MALIVEQIAFTLATTDTGSKVVPLSAQWSSQAPKAAIFFGCGLNAQAWADHAIIGIGVGCDSGEAAKGFMSQDAAASTTLTRREHSLSECFAVMTSAGVADAAFSWGIQVNGSLTIDVTDSPAADMQIIALVIGGDDITDADVSNLDIGNTLGPLDVTTGFQPDLAIAIGTNQFSEGVTTIGVLCFGIANGSGQFCSSIQSVDNASTSNGRRIYHADKFVDLQIATSSQRRTADFVQFLADGYRVNVTDGASSLGRTNVLCLKGIGAVVGNEQQPAANGAQTLTGAIGTTAKGLVTSSTMDSVLATIGDDATFVVGCSDMTNNANALVTDERGQTSMTNTDRRLDLANAIYMTDPARTANGSATAAASGADVTLTWAGTDATARNFGYLIIGEKPGPPPLPTGTGSRRRRMAGARR